MFRPQWATVFMKAGPSGWSGPVFPEFLSTGEDLEIFFAPDGRTVYMTSVRPQTGESKSDGDIWSMTMVGQNWSDPFPLSSAINTEHWEQQPSVTRGGTLYFLGQWDGGGNGYGIYRSVPVDKLHLNPELLPPSVNSPYVDWTPFIAPDESFLLFSSTRPGGFGGGDIYLSHRAEDGSWSEPRNLGSKVNTEANERYPYVSPDGEILFFVSDRVTGSVAPGTPTTYSEVIELSNGPGNGYSDVYWITASAVGLPWF